MLNYVLVLRLTVSRWSCGSHVCHFLANITMVWLSFCEPLSTRTSCDVSTTGAAFISIPCESWNVKKRDVRIIVKGFNVPFEIRPCGPQNSLLVPWTRDREFYWVRWVPGVRIRGELGLGVLLSDAIYLLPTFSFTLLKWSTVNVSFFICYAAVFIHALSCRSERNIV